MSPKILLVAAAAMTLTGAAAVPASAAPGDAPKMPLRATVMFNLVDRNGDGSIDKDELDAVRNAIFAAIDANGDGKLSKDEIQAVGQGMRDRAQQRPHFGWQGGPPRDGRGPMMDGGRPRDGRGPMMDGGPRPPGPRQGMLDDRQGPPPFGITGQTGAPDPGPLAGPQGLATADQNADGTITRDEFAAGMLPGMAALFGR
ncbi:hypothetical protein BH10PSE9_BH10PSE9_23760 [soil metagenome]